MGAIRETASASTTPSLGVVAPRLSHQWLTAQIRRWGFKPATDTKVTEQIFPRIIPS